MTQYKQNNACIWCNIASQYVYILLHRHIYIRIYIWTVDLILVITSRACIHIFLSHSLPIVSINQTGRPFKCVNIVDSDINLILLSHSRFSPHCKSMSKNYTTQATAHISTHILHARASSTQMYSKFSIPWKLNETHACVQCAYIHCTPQIIDSIFFSEENITWLGWKLFDGVNGNQPINFIWSSSCTYSTLSLNELKCTAIRESSQSPFD